MAKYRQYKKDLEFSYALGTYPTLDLLKYAPQHVQMVAINSKSVGSDGVQDIIQLCQQKGIRYEMADRMIERIAVKENTYCIGVFRKFSTTLDAQKNHVALVGPRDMGNLGTIIRTMAGFGQHDLIIIRPAADLFDPKVVRSAMGALFQLRFQYFETFDQYRQAFPKHQLYPFMLDGSTPLPEVQFQSPYTLVFGNEGQGLPPHFAELGQSVYIPHTAAIDSLNLSVAAGIALWQANRP